MLWLLALVLMAVAALVIFKVKKGKSADDTTEMSKARTYATREGREDGLSRDDDTLAGSKIMPDSELDKPKKTKSGKKKKGSGKKKGSKKAARLAAEAAAAAAAAEAGNADVTGIPPPPDTPSADTYSVPTPVGSNPEPEILAPPTEDASANQAQNQNQNLFEMAGTQRETLPDDPSAAGTGATAAADPNAGAAAPEQKKKKKRSKRGSKKSKKSKKSKRSKRSKREQVAAEVGAVPAAGQDDSHIPATPQEGAPAEAAENLRRRN